MENEDLSWFCVVLDHLWTQTQKDAFRAAPIKLRELVVRDMWQMCLDALQEDGEVFVSGGEFMPQQKVRRKVGRSRPWFETDMFHTSPDGNYLFDVGYYFECGSWAVDLAKELGVEGTNSPDEDAVYELLNILAC